jgi:hypothetical protein
MKREQLKVHVLNAYQGDSILIEFPNNIWGVVDSNRKHKHAPVPALEFLKKMEKLNRIDKIAFIALTHPHFDHFRGLCNIIETFREKIDRFWDFGVKVKPIANYFYRIYRDDEEKQRADEFYELYNLILEIRTERQSEGKRFYDNCSSFKLMLTLSPNIDVIALSPSGDDQQDYMSKISLYDADKLPSGLRGLDHNQISSILLIRFYQHFIILGSDADKKIWGRILRDERRISLRDVSLMVRPADCLKSEIVKVSHHGSTTSLHPELWQTLSIPGITVAIISADGVVNPRKETVQAILSSGAQVFCTNKPLQKDFPFQLKPQTLSAFKSRNVIPISTEEPKESYMTVTIDADGNVTNQPENVYEFVDLDTIQLL